MSIQGELEQALLREAQDLHKAKTALQDYARTLERAAKTIRAFIKWEADIQELQSFYTLSPAGDGYGCDTYYIAPKAKGWNCPDAVKLAEFMAEAPERIKNIVEAYPEGKGGKE